MADILQQKFPTGMLPPPKFEEWAIYEYRYTNINPTVSMEENSKFVLMQQAMLDNDNYTVLLPFNRDRGTSFGIPNVIRHWGRVCQFVSPMIGTARGSLLPMIGVATDSQIYLQYEWTYQIPYERKMVKKIGKMELERLPITKTVTTHKPGNVTEENTGYVWEGTLEVSIEKCEELTLFFSQPQKRPSTSLVGSPTNTTSTNSNSLQNLTKEKEATTQVYHVEMVIESSNLTTQAENEVDYENQNEGIVPTPRA
ncbi:hypothetical protein RFI_10267 [Reticulomyxa filosa]|uniref:Uncharacterized protein n=1 Tax=Reticulomyxa filosa TaxID=46433 RepID=X6NND4_RETFI|nr:hypothetical protein RFI_10267 [Reticulomyxa filosa]|eukprot:ETO26867.1 hypothetical protein RFI_10267 [Reticulomyxa filosa]